MRDFEKELEEISRKRRNRDMRLGLFYLSVFMFLMTIATAVLTVSL